jgi:hypothetical protein
MAEVDQLVSELLVRSDMNDDTVVDLNRILDNWRAGSLDADDEAYLRAFHARIFETPISEPAVSTMAEPERLEGLTVADWRDRALRAEAQVADMQEAARNG